MVNHKPNCNCCVCKAIRGETTFSDDHRRKLSLALKGKPKSEEHIKKIKEAKKGLKPRVHIASCLCYFCKSKRGEFKGKNHPHFGKRGNRCHNYIDGRTSITKLIRESNEYKNWRKRVFERDNYTCQECNKHGGKLEAHHVKEFHKIFENYISLFRDIFRVDNKEKLVRLTKAYKPFWDITNGKTLCRDCHDKTKKRGQVTW